MSDLEEFIALFDRLGVEYQKYEGDLLCKGGDRKVEGYSWFFTKFEFNELGKFIQMGAYDD